MAKGNRKGIFKYILLTEEDYKYSKFAPQATEVILQILKDLPESCEHKGDEVEEASGFSINMSHYNLPDKMFQEQFRMSKSTFQILYDKTGRYFASFGTNGNSSPGHINITMMLAVLCVVASPDYFKTVADKFDMNKGALHRHYRRFIRFLTLISKDYIKWPSQNEKQEVKEEFERISGYPGIVGAVNGYQIKIVKPFDDYDNKVGNQKKLQAIKLQVVCNSKQLFTDIYIGATESLNNASLFKNSRLFTSLGQNVSKDEHLVGNSSYPLLERLMVPYKESGFLSLAQSNHNKCLNKARAVIDVAFKRLVRRWRRLRNLEAEVVGEAVETVVAACVLHNFLVLEGKDEVDPEDCDDSDDSLGEIQREFEPETNRELLKRNEIAVRLTFG